MRMNDDGSDQLELLDEEFDERISAVLMEITPDLVNRAQRSDFAKWYRIRGLVDDLVQETAYRFFTHCKKHQTIPEYPLGYAVRIARHVVYEEIRKAKRRPLDLANDDVAEGLPDRPAL